MKWLTALVEQMLETVKNAARIPVLVGWRPSQTPPSAVIQMKNCEITPLDLSASKHLVDASLQVDVWHVSAKSRDEVVEKILTALEEKRTLFSEELGVFSLSVEGVADVGDESGFRKMLLVRVRMVV
ncbi:MAG: hypothetical protein RMI43_05375 [Candidatus Caldarchaeum sp.]|nr:hypothetical protein [Candidatus Caldarchaeum sp.]MCX8200816.1 hypothetical protein [Candidatus Caldarchaeum sp.]MDW8063581.1 hypothetical protein [Candidatus Caldarchaeum sp.]MDW8434798.1 hypothetical protein [Candidatus Caldarchaeum sp.]